MSNEKEPIKMNLTTLIIILMFVLLLIGVIIYYFATNTTTGKTVYEDVAMKKEKEEKYRKYVITDNEENIIAENVIENTIIENTVINGPIEEKNLNLEDAKKIITNYFSMLSTKGGNPKTFLESLKIVNKFSFTKDEFITSKDGLAHLYKTNVKYLDYKVKMLESMTEKKFNEDFSEKFEEHNGYLYFEGDVTNTGNTYNFTNIELITAVGITVDYKATYKNANGVDESYKVRLVKVNDKYVVDSYELLVN